MVGRVSELLNLCRVFYTILQVFNTLTHTRAREVNDLMRFKKRICVFYDYYSRSWSHRLHEKLLFIIVKYVLSSVRNLYTPHLFMEIRQKKPMKTARGV